MRYLGGKSLLADNIVDFALAYTVDVKSVFDVFAGSGAVTRKFILQGFTVTTNDILYFSYVLMRGTFGVNKTPQFKKLGINNPIEYLNSLTLENTDFNQSDLFIYNNYSPNGDCNRMYFQPTNALKIDIIRLTIEQWRNHQRITDDEYFYLLACLISAVPYVSNIAGVYAAYLKHWDKRTYNALMLENLQINETAHKCRCLNSDYMNVISTPVDMVYADPPYNSREYLPNYHILETIARYDYPAIKGITGMRHYSEIKSPFCSKRTVERAFENLIKCCKARYLMISYNNESLLSTARLSELCTDYAINDSFKLIEMDYRRYKSKIPNNNKGLKEQIYFLQLR